MTKNNKIWENSGGPTQLRSDPTQRQRVPTLQCGLEGEFGQAWVRCGKALRRSVAVLRRSVATIHNMEICCVLFCFVIPLFQGHVYRINEDLISVYKGPFMFKKVKETLDCTSPPRRSEV